MQKEFDFSSIFVFFLDGCKCDRKAQTTHQKKKKKPQHWLR